VSKIKICWDELENAYLSNKGNLRKNNNTYIFMEKCGGCGEPYLASTQQVKRGKGKFCSYSCSQKGDNNNFYGKKRLDHSKRMSGRNNPNWKNGFREKKLASYDVFAYQIKWCEDVKRNEIDKRVLDIKCTYCGEFFTPSLSQVQGRISSLNGYSKGEHRIYCSDNCKQECSIFYRKNYPKGFKISTSREVQPELRQLVLKRDNYTCQKCNKHKNKLEVGLHCHHLEGIRWEPLESADIDKCLTLCKKCHKKVHMTEGCKYAEMRC